MVREAVLRFLDYVGYQLPLLVVVLVVIWIGKLVNDLLTHYKIDEELTDKNNAAVGITLAGYYIGLAIAIVGVMLGPESENFWKDLMNVGIYSVIAIILLNIATLVNDKLILYKFNNEKELVEDQNSGTGATMAGSYLATGLIVNAAVSGEVAGGWWRGLLACIVFFILGQVVLVIAGLWYQLITRYDVHKVIGEDNNTAAGVAFGGFLFAIGYVVRAAMIGVSTSWAVDLVSFALYVVIAFIILTIGEWITDKVFLPKAKTSDEIGSQGNIAAAAISVAVDVAIAVLVVHVI